MATITLYKDKLNGVGGLIDNIIKSSNNLDTQLGTLKSTLQGVSNSTYNLQDTVNSISSSSKTEKEKVSDLKKLNKQVTEFIATTVKRDNSARDEINKSKKEFYSKYSYLKPDCEKNAIEKIVDKVEKAAEWCAKHWKLIATAVIVVVAVALIATGVGAGIGGTLLVGACWGASAAFAGLGVAGSALGKGISCASKLGKAIKGTAAVSKVLSLGMAGFDMISLADMAIDNKNNPIADLNKKLHSSKAYNIFQTSVSALAVFTGGMTTTMSCFIAGTLVATKKGKIPIEEVKCNDWVLSAAPNTLRKSYKRVENIFNRQVDFLIHLYISGDEIVTSDNHPFYIVGKGFVAASLLCVGMQLIDANGDVHVLENIYREQCNSKVCVYNFTVEDFHTYFIGQNTILVHNAECNVAFNKKSKYDQKEYEQQLNDQQEGLNKLTLEEYKNNRETYIKNGRNPEGQKYQTAARDKEVLNRQLAYMKKGVDSNKALQLAKQDVKGLAALHGPDQIAGGRADNITGLGNSGINSSIGSQWKSRVNVLDDYVNSKISNYIKSNPTNTNGWKNLHLDVELSIGN
ncbi:polymorphic toxin type 15 domain-containing protein [Eubacterium ventriosum]|nr:polymorphic toxin type 15 domain-containing protein [Eubacterium ventriosum]MBT9697098.1 hypothetical protein [Eubacterium ventriosum]